MTRKENLLKKKYELQNELRILRGEEPYDIDALTTGWRFRDNAQKEREYRLKADIESLEKSIEKQKADNDKKAKSNAYYETEEGKTFKAQLTNQKDIEIQAFEEYENNMLEVFKTWIKGYLGSHWTVKHLYDHGIGFGVWDADKTDFVFGQTLEIRCERHHYWKDGREQFETNVGTTGSFDILEQNIGDRALFYVDLGKFLSDKIKLNELKERMFLYSETLDMMRKRIREINNKLENPLGL